MEGRLPSVTLLFGGRATGKIKIGETGARRGKVQERKLDKEEKGSLGTCRWMRAGTRKKRKELIEQSPQGEKCT